MLCVNSRLPPRRGERCLFRSSQYARCMEARHDLRKFITELPVAERGAVLSSGREVLVPSRLGREIAQRGEMTTARLVRTSPKRISDPKRIDELTMWGTSPWGRGSRARHARAATRRRLRRCRRQRPNSVPGEWSIGVWTLPCGVPDRRTDRPTVRPISALRPES